MQPIAEVVAAITMGDLILAGLATAVARDTAVALLPDRIAGPGGWLVDTSGRR
jgi:hypothetical protein